MEMTTNRHSAKVPYEEQGVKKTLFFLPRNESYPAGNLV
jgi:hypothetical protein